MAYLIDWRRWHIVIERRKQRNLAIKPSIRNKNRRLANEDSRFFFSFFVCAAILCLRFENSPLGTPLATHDAFSSLSLSLPLCIATLCKCLFSIRSEVFFPFSPPSQIMSREIRRKERERLHRSPIRLGLSQQGVKQRGREKRGNRIKFQASVTPARAPIHMPIEHLEMHGSFVGAAW